MWNFMYLDEDSGEEFFIQCDTKEQSLTIAADNGFDLEGLSYEGKYTDEEAGWYGFDMYYENDWY